jgi:hypothetical protein
MKSRNIDVATKIKTITSQVGTRIVLGTPMAGPSRKNPVHSISINTTAIQTETDAFIAKAK